ncbi:MAG: hypothetical protein MUE69_07525 [Myxococcota bacterium]|jgi:hypothetical protein|nr:hypothetical protein [Myxococcota bacterium]
MWTERSTDDARRERVTWVATIGAALASVPVAAMVIDLYGLDGYHRVVSPALLPIVTTAFFARLFVRWAMRASSTAIVVLIGPLLGLVNASLMAGLFSAFEQGEVAAMFGAMILATMIGFPVSLSVGLAFGFAMWPLLGLERHYRGREDLDARLGLDGFAAGWGLVVAALTFALEAHAPLALYQGGPAVVGVVAVVVASAFAVAVAIRYARLGRALQRMARGDDAEHRLVVAKGSLAERFERAELVVVRVARAGEGPFRDGELAEPVAGVVSIPTLARRIAALALVASIAATTVALVRPDTTVRVAIQRAPGSSFVD